MKHICVLLLSVLMAFAFAEEPQEKFGYKVVVKNGDESGSGSGVAVNLEKYGLGKCVLTAAHVLIGAASVEIVRNERSIPCEVLWADTEIDAVALKPKEDLKNYADVSADDPVGEIMRMVVWPRGVGPKVTNGVRLPVFRPGSILHMLVSKEFDFGCSGGGIFVVSATGEEGKVCGIAVEGYARAVEGEKEKKIISTFAMYLPMRRILATIAFRSEK